MCQPDKLSMINALNCLPGSKETMKALQDIGILIWYVVKWKYSLIPVLTLNYSSL